MMESREIYSPFLIMEAFEYLLIPDVHCREFWKEPVKEVLETTNKPIIFFGDYVDGYPKEFEDESYIKRGIANLEEIVELKKKYKNRIILLLGNHDCGYAIEPRICSSRQDKDNYNKISKLFKDNRELFQIAIDFELDDKHIVCSHAGISLNYIEQFLIKQLDPVKQLNNAWLTNNEEVLQSLGVYSHYRGWCGYDFGSPIWADIREFIIDDIEPYGDITICGHSQVKVGPFISGNIIDIDSREAYILTSNCKVDKYEL